MIARIFWFAALTVLALVTIGVQLDRQTRGTPAIAENVPEMFRSTAQLAVAAYAMQRDDTASALTEAERLVRRRPMPAEHLRVLAQAQILDGAVDEGALSIQYAAQRGWRDPLAQEALLRLALEAGDKDEAARRYAALFLRRDTEDALLQEFGQAILDEPGGEGRQTLITIVGGGDRWHSQFLGRGPRVMPTGAFVEIVRETVANGTRYDCSALRNIDDSIGRQDADAGAAFSVIVQEQC